MLGKITNKLMAVSGIYIVSVDRYKLIDNKLSSLMSNEDFYSKASFIISTGWACLSYERFYTLYQVLKNFKNPNVVEVGVFKGGGSYFMASVMGNGNLWSFDTFEGHDVRDISDNDNIHKEGNFSDTSFEIVSMLMCRFKFAKIIKGRFQDKCDVLKDVKIDVAHIDVDIYLPTLFALKFISERLSKNGIIVCDDYGVASCEGVKKAVDEFISSSDKFMPLHLISGQMLLIRK